MECDKGTHGSRRGCDMSDIRHGVAGPRPCGVPGGKDERRDGAGEERGDAQT